MMKILSIGNSFSTDAQRYLYELAKQDGVTLKTVNLYIGGCSLRMHYLNMLDDQAAYAFEFNSVDTNLKVSIRQALESDDWDVVTLQQASRLSGEEKTYFPYIEALAEYVRKYCPHAKIFIHQTWAYEDGSDWLHSLGYQTATEMFEKVQACYAKAAQTIKAHGVIPCGEAMITAFQNGLTNLHRDTYHASYGVGRYLLALTWYKTLTGKEVGNNAFDALDEAINDSDRKIVIESVEKSLSKK
ncbi:MAG: DUF4886 domain-containing protein [Clostridia bacterium]|nr:DUF4886 domain-containing protein [Clostridia bacterium]